MPGSGGTPTAPAADLLTVNGKHGSVRRDGRWTLPGRPALRTAWCDVMLDLADAVRSAPELVVDLPVRGGNRERRIIGQSMEAAPPTMPVTQARMRFSDLVNRVAYDHRPIRLTRRERVMVGLISPSTTTS